jgi:methylenetetrahydrofolate reductase (NADPH)
MKITEIWKSKTKPTISFELFPARSDKAADKLVATIDELAALEPDFVSVTFGAGGSTREGSYQLIEKLAREKSLEVVAYFAGYGLGPDDITNVLDSYMELGLDNLLIVRGDAPQDQEGFIPHPQSMEHASDILAFVRPKYACCIGVAGHPEGHLESANPGKDIELLKHKVDCGAEYIITNYFYDNRFYFDFVDRCRASGIELPILPGIMPIYSVKMMEMLAGLCGATITDGVRKGLAALPEGDKDALTAFGVDFAVEQCTGLLNSGVPGLHIYTMDRSISTQKIISQLREQSLL